MNNLAFENVSMPTVIESKNVQAEINGSIPLPEGRELNKVLSCSGRIIVTGCDVSDGVVTVNGKIILEPICVGDDIYAFSSAATFVHTVTIEKAKSEMSAFASGELIELETSESGGGIAFSAVADVFCRLESHEEKRVATKAGDGDVEVQVKSEINTRRVNICNEDIYISEETVAADVSEIIRISGNAMIRDVHITQDVARLDGILCINALCKNRNGEPMQFIQNLPFTSDVELDYECSSDTIGKLEVTSLNAKLLGEEYGLISIEADINVKLFMNENEEISVINDAFSPTDSFECIKSDCRLILSRGVHEQKAMFKCNIKPDNADNPKAVYAEIRPVIVSAVKSDNGVVMEGIAFISLIYIDINGNIGSKNVEEGYSVTMPIDYDGAEIDAKAICTGASVTRTSDGGAEVSYTLQIRADVYELKDISAVIDTKPCESKRPPAGFNICIAADGESVYDMAKRLNTSSKSIMAANPHLGDNMKEGDKVIVFI